MKGNKTALFLNHVLPVTVFGYGCCAALAMVVGASPNELIGNVVSGAWGDWSGIVMTLSKTPPLLLTGLSVALAYRAGLLNIGCEGQLTLGALAAASLARQPPPLPPWVWLPCVLLGGALAGALWAAPALWLRDRRGVHEVVSTLILNYLTLHLADYLVRYPLSDGSGMGRTAMIATGAWWHPLVRVGGMGLTSAPLVALGLTLGAAFWLHRSVWGFEVRAVGSNEKAAANAGIAVRSWQWRIFLLSGALSGFAGAVEMVAVHHRFYAAFSPGYGYDGITVAFLAGTQPAWLWTGSLLLASLRSTDKWLQLAMGISPNVVFVIEAALLLGVTCQPGMTGWWEGIQATVGHMFSRDNRSGKP